jgi:hypothetical protein
MFMFAQDERSYWQGRADFEPFCRALLAGDLDAVFRTSEAWVRQSRSYWPPAASEADG